MAGADGGVEETRMEAFVLSEIEAVEHVVVSGVGRQYLACLLTLHTVRGTTTLSEPALRFVRAAGSNATTVDEARKCTFFKNALLKGFAGCNKMVYESCKRAGLQEKPAQLRRYTILSDQWSVEDGTLLVDGKINRREILSRYAQVVESMYGAVMTNTVEAARVSNTHSSIVASAISDLGGSLSQPPTLTDPLAAASMIPTLPGPPHGVPPPPDNTLAPAPSLEVSPQSVESNGVGGAVLEPPSGQDLFPTFPDGISIPSGSSAIVKDRAPPPSAMSKCWSSLRALCPCAGPHSQVLDDDILNPGHTVAKRRPAPGTMKPKPAANKPAAPPTQPTVTPSSQDYPHTPGGLYMSQGVVPMAPASLYQTQDSSPFVNTPPQPPPQGVFV